MSQNLEELRAAAEAEFAASRTQAPATEVEVPEVIEDDIEHPAEEPIESPAEVVEEPVIPVETVREEKPTNRRTVYTRTVDLGDGSHTQVFKAATKDEFIEKLFNAQVNASKRILDLKEENKKLRRSVQPDPAYVEKTYETRDLTEDEELQLSNELQTNPSQALKKALKALLGADIEEVRSDLAIGRKLQQKETIREIGQSFVAAHPDYPSNSSKAEKLMAEYIQKNKLAWTLKNLELAYEDLVEAGLVTPLGSEPVEILDDPSALEESVIEKNEPTPEVKPAPAATLEPALPAGVPATSVVTPRRRRTVVGISSSQAVATVEPEAPRELSVEDLLNLNQAERRRIVQRQFAR